MILRIFFKHFGGNMERRGFLKRLFGISVSAAALSVPAIAKAVEKDTFTFDEAFINHDGNKDLYYIRKDSRLNRELMKAIGDHYLPIDKFGCYYPVYGQYVQIKDEYTIEDFRQLIMLLEDKKEHFDYFCDGQMKNQEVGLIRLIKDRSGKFYKIDLFQAFRNGMYGPK